MAYSTERRAAVLKKLEPPHAVSLRQLAKDVEGGPNPGHFDAMVCWLRVLMIGRPDRR